MSNDQTHATNRDQDHVDDDVAEEEEEEDVDFNPFLKDTASPEASSSLSSETDTTHLTPSAAAAGRGNAIKSGEEVIQNEGGGGGDADVALRDGDVTVEEEDAICRRTRAKYSLEGFTLDQLESFLQETDDEDDFRNVDDEEEYRKFLAAVLNGDGEDNGGGGGNGGVEAVGGGGENDEDDDDLDFEIELEELLDSDVENEGEREGRPETRLCSRRSKASRIRERRKKTKKNKEDRVLEHVKRPLRPLVPILPIVGGFGGNVGMDFRTVYGRNGYAGPVGDGGLVARGFTQQQFCQLYCLIHEHVQLLVQVFSLCILNPARQHVAAQVQGLIVEMLKKRDEVLTSKRRRDNVSDDDQVGSVQTGGFFWLLGVNGPLLSVLDVAALNFVGRYMDDVSKAVKEYRQRRVDPNVDTWNEREPLFHHPHFSSVVEGNNNQVAEDTVPSTPGQQVPKKTLAASIVERAQKQSIALVPKEISKLAQIFSPLFNPGLFPHKPPPAAVANRILFNDSEDELLALGIMEYNTDWKAIQQRYLPCKSKHQIFVRQKNRCSSKAPENPIKAVRRMKTSPLTAEERERMQEGLRIFKSDWMSVWKFAVPHRDPSLLPRQWRIANGTQKSYKQDDATKERRRIYESNRRRMKPTNMESWQMESEKQDNEVAVVGGQGNSADDRAENANNVFVHQAFLSDWRLSASSISLQRPSSDLPSDSCVGEQLNHCRPAEVLPRTESLHEFPCLPKCHQYVHHSSHVMHANLPTSQSDHLVSDRRPSTSKAQFNSWSSRACRTSGARLVQLAPELPPVNLPPSVRVMSQSSFRSNQFSVPAKVLPPAGGRGDVGNRKVAPQPPDVAATNSAKPAIDHQVMHNFTDSGSEGSTGLHPDESASVLGTCVVEERGTDSGFQMHPLLFQAPEDGRLPYYLHCSTDNSNAFSFFSGNQPQLNLCLFHNPNQANHATDHLDKASRTEECSSASRGIDFHPLLQRTEEESVEPVARCSNISHSGKMNELDLEIHLSSTSRKVGATRCKDGGANMQPRTTSSRANPGNALGTRRTKDPSNQRCEDHPVVHGTPVPESDVSSIPCNRVNECLIEDMGDQSHPEIVMEQEELSDSDEDIEENVEFECEEMADSEGEEGSCSEPVVEAHDKDIPSLTLEKCTSDAVYSKKLSELRNNISPPIRSSHHMEGSPPLNLSLTSHGKDPSSDSWLSLDSRAHIGSSSMKSKPDESSAAKNMASYIHNKPCKKPAPSTKRVAMQKDVMDMAQQLSLGPLDVSTLKRPRKRSCRTRTNTSNGMEMVKQTSNHDRDKFS